MHMLNIDYRRATIADAKKLSILYKQVYIHTYGTEGVSDEFANFITKQFAVDRLEQLIHQSPDHIIVAAYSNNLVGVAELAFNKRSPIGDIVAPELSKLYILDWFCGKGIGYRLLQEAERTAASKGHEQIWLWVLHSNQRAISFYERQQYICIGNASFQMEVNNYDNKVMVKKLQ